MTIQAFGLTDLGRERTGNEDAYLCDPKAGLFVVCDGMGGHAAGEVASQHTVQGLQGAILGVRPAMIEAAAMRAGTEPIAQAMRASVVRSCSELHQMGVKDKAKKGMGTTCTALAVAGTRAVLAHVGDSRCYLLRQGQITQISSDHTYVAEAIRAGILKREDADSSPFGNVITRAVGPQATVLVDIVAFDLAAGDTVLLCSDGLHQYFKDDAELGTLMAGPSLEATARRLIALANERGGSDNISVVLLRLPTAGAPSQIGTLARVDAMRHVDLFQDLTMAEVIRLCQAFNAREVATGDFIIREGDQADAFYVLVDGEAEVTRGQQKVASLPKGSHFGEMSLLAQKPRTASVRATKTCHLLMTSRSTLFPFLEREPMLAAKVFWKMAHTLSLRLDDLYNAAPVAPATAKSVGRDTIKFGSYPTNNPPAPPPSKK